MHITTRRLRLRPFTLDDTDALHAMWTDPGVRRYLWDDVVITRERAAAVVADVGTCWETRGYGMWTIAERQGSRPIGFCGFRPDAAGAIELLYGLRPGHWGRGLAVEAARAALTWGFERHRWPGVVAATDVPNTQSVRVLEKLGMRMVRVGMLNGLPTTFFAITWEEWERCRQSSSSASTSPMSGARSRKDRST